ncbi:hypothetical protein SCALM49S_04702 [Streptomyces californicus]
MDDEARSLIGESDDAAPEPSFPFVPRIARLPRDRRLDRSLDRQIERERRWTGRWSARSSGPPRSPSPRST